MNGLQVLWLTGEMVKTGVAGADKLRFALLKQLPAGSTQPGELYIAENLMHILLDNRSGMNTQYAGYNVVKIDQMFIVGMIIKNVVNVLGGDRKLQLRRFNTRKFVLPNTLLICTLYMYMHVHCVLNYYMYMYTPLESGWTPNLV